MRDAHLLHLAQSVPMQDENSALRGNLPHRDDDDGGKNPRLSFSPASSVWGQMGCPWTSIGHSVTGTTEKITEADYVAFFHQFFGFTNNPAVWLLSRMCNTLISGISWVVTVLGIISTVATAIVQTGPSRMSTFCRRWSASVRPPATPPAASGCSRARATVVPIWKSAIYEWLARPIC